MSEENSDANRKFFEAFDVRFSIAASDAKTIDCLAAAFPPGAREIAARAPHREYSHDEIGGVHRVQTSGETICESENIAQVLDALENDAQFFVAQNAPHHVFIHAGVVGWNNRALVFPGRSFCGKSTLVAELIKSGAIYYSDEYAVFDARGLVFPYARALSLRRENDSSLRISARELGAKTGTQPLPVGAIFVSHFQKDAIWNPQKLSPGAAVLALLDNAVAARARTQEVLRTLEKVVGKANCFQSARGDAEEIARAILNEPGA